MARPGLCSRMALGALLLLGAAGAALAVAPAVPVANPCTQVPADTVRLLLFGDAGGTLDSWGDHPSPDRDTCLWEARPAATSGASDGGGGVRRLRLTVRRFADAATAHAALPALPAAEAIASDALVPGAGDELVRQPDNSTATARHGAVLATLDATEAAPDAAPWAVRYWLDAAALGAAGGASRPPPSLPGVMPPGQGTANGAPRWAPPPHDAGAAGRALAPLLVLVRALADWRFFALLPLLVAGGWLATRAGRPRWVHWAGRLLALYGLVNLVLGTNLANALVYHLGATGAGLVVDRYATSTQYNNQQVSGFHVLIRAADGQVAPGRFADDDFNVYPSHNATAYPSVDDQFTVRYPAGFPGWFVIVANDASPWARGLACGRLLAADEALRRRLGFADADAATPALRRQAADSTRALRDAGCQ